MPFPDLGIVEVVWVVIGSQEVGVAIGPADVFRWAVSSTFQQERQIDERLLVEELLDLDGVIPGVAEVIEVFERFSADVFYKRSNSVSGKW